MGEEEFTSDTIPDELLDEVQSSFGDFKLDVVGDYHEDDSNRPKVNETWRSFKAETSNKDPRRVTQKMFDVESGEFKEKTGYNQYSFKIRVEFPEGDLPVLRSVSGFEVFKPED